MGIGSGLVGSGTPVAWMRRFHNNQNGTSSPSPTNNTSLTLAHFHFLVPVPPPLYPPLSTSTQLKVSTIYNLWRRGKEKSDSISISTPHRTTHNTTEIGKEGEGVEREQRPPPLSNFLSTSLQPSNLPSDPQCQPNLVSLLPSTSTKGFQHSISNHHQERVSPIKGRKFQQKPTATLNTKKEANKPIVGWSDMVEEQRVRNRCCSSLSFSFTLFVIHSFHSLFHTHSKCRQSLGMLCCENETSL